MITALERSLMPISRSWRAGQEAHFTRAFIRSTEASSALQI